MVVEEVPSGSQPDRARKVWRQLLSSYWILLNLLVLLLGANILFIGVFFYERTKDLYHTITMSVGVVILAIALGLYAAKGIKELSRWRRTRETFEKFSDENETVVTPDRTPDLELNDQHLPSGVLRLKEEY